MEGFGTDSKAVPEQAENRGDAPDRCQRGPDPSLWAACSKPLPAVPWQVQVLSDRTAAENKLLNQQLHTTQPYRR